MFDLLKRTFRDWTDDDCPRMAAAMSYYTVFSLPPLLLVVLALVGLFVDPTRVEGRIQAEMAGVLGAEGAAQIQEMIRNATRPGEGGAFVVVAGVVGLLLGATGAFAQLQDALNRAWEVAPDPRRGGIKAMVGKRLLSLGMVGTIAFLLLVSLVLSAALTAFGDSLGAMLPGGVSQVVLQLVNTGVSLVVVTLLFALLFKVVPDADVTWKAVGVGAAGTAVLFVAGKFLLGLWFAKSNPGEAYGAAGSLALILAWVYYSAMIVFFGAEFTQAWAKAHGHAIAPSKGAVRVGEARRLRAAARKAAHEKDGPKDERERPDDDEARPPER